MICVLFKDGKHGWYVRYNVEGACLVGDPTVYVYRQVGSAMTRVYVKPGDAASWIEA